ncbi:MAG: exopolysaccharide transport family protein [Pseudomonadota bacterium]
MNTTASPDDIDITALWRAVMDRKKTLLASSFGVAALTFLALSLVTPQYTSTTRLIIENDQSVYDRPTGQQNQSNDVVALLDKEAVLSQVQVLRSNDLALKVIEDLRLNMSPEFNDGLKAGGVLAGIVGGAKGTEEERVLRAFTDALTVYPIKDSRIIAVDMTSQDPKTAASAANTLAEKYLEWQRGRQTDQTKDETESLRRQLADLKAQVEAADFKLEKFRSETGLYSGQNNTTLSQQQLSEINSQLSRAKAQRSEAEARARQIKEMLGNGTVDSAPDVLRSQLIQRLLEQRVQVQRRVSELSASLRSGHPRMRQAMSELGTINSQIRREVRKIVRGLENEARIASARETSLRQSLDQVREQASKTGNDQVRLTLLDREATSKRELYDATIRKFDEARSAASRRNVPVFARVVEKARVTSIPSFPQKLPMAIFAGVATLLLGLAWFVTRALLSAARPANVAMQAGPMGSGGPSGNGGGLIDRTGRIIGGDAAGHAPVAASGAVAAGVATATGAAMWAEKNPVRSTPSTETIGGLESRTARIADTLLERGDGKAGYRTMVTTTLKGHSALSTAYDVARHLARAGARVVLISAEPGSAVMPNAQSAAAGLTDVLSGNATLQDAVRHATLESVDVIEAGSKNLDWSDATQTETVNRFLDGLDAHYDHVLVAAEPDVGAQVFSLVEGRFDHGLVSGAGAEASRDRGYFLGFHIPEFSVATLEPAQRIARSDIRARYAPAPGLTTAAPGHNAPNGT